MSTARTALTEAVSTARTALTEAALILTPQGLLGVIYDGHEALLLGPEILDSRIHCGVSVHVNDDVVENLCEEEERNRGEIKIMGYFVDRSTISPHHS